MNNEGVNEVTSLILIMQSTTFSSVTTAIAVIGLAMQENARNCNKRPNRILLERFQLLESAGSLGQLAKFW